MGALMHDKQIIQEKTLGVASKTGMLQIENIYACSPNSNMRI